MLYQWLYKLSEHHSLFNVFRYITFRTFLAFLTAFLIGIYIGPRFIKRLVRKQIGQSIREDGPKTHKKKAGTPTMGGGLILICLAVPCLMWADFYNPYVWGTLIITLGFGLIGYVDDYLKVSKKNTRGLKGKVRLFFEFLISGVVVYYLVNAGYLSTGAYVPFLKGVIIPFGVLYPLFAAFVIVGCANAVNLTDGLDGLAIMPVIIASGTFLILAYVAGQAVWAKYLMVPHSPFAAELTPVAGAMVAAGLAFLWFNSYPAQVFMGDVGSLSIGGFLGALAVFTKNEFLLIVVGGVFVAVALSVIIQVVYFKMSGGKRVFRMAPLQHHFELGGMEEPKIIVRFWIVSILLAVISLASLKLR